MTVPSKYRNASNALSLIIAIGSIATVTLCAVLFGFSYETKKLKAFLATITFILLYHFYFGDVILIFVKAIINTYLLRPPWIGAVNPMFIGGPNRKDYLKRRLKALKAQLNLGPTFYKRNEAMTLKYRKIYNDLILFGGYFLLLIILSIGMRDTHMYYNTRTIKDVLTNPKFSAHATSTIITISDLYDFINGTIVDGFIEGRSYNNKSFSEAGWMGQQIAKVLGVVRLRQIRYDRTSNWTYFDRQHYGPGWMKYNPELEYQDRFWRIFQPWKYQTALETEAVQKTGKVHNLPGGGYVAYLGRNSENTFRVLQLLYKNYWIDSYTAGILIEFTLYNVDADVFTMVIIFAEQTGFNTFVVTVSVDTLKLLFNVDNITWYALLSFFFYFVVFMRVLAFVVQKMWYASSMRRYLSKSWNYVDMVIIGLNIAVAFAVWHREVYVKKLLQELEVTKKNKFISFYHAAVIDETCTVLVAFLVALTTFRLWKILQFARVFRVLTHTLHVAKRPLLSVTYFVGVFIAGIGIGAFIINGSNSENFVELFSSIASLISMSFGFTVSVKPSDLNYGGGMIGFVLYLVLIITVTIFLLNMFITIVCLCFGDVKEEDEESSENADDYSFWHFLVTEVTEGWTKRFRKHRKKVRKDDHEQAEHGMEEDTLRLRGGGGRFGKPKDNSPIDVEQERRMNLISEIIDTQMELLQEKLSANMPDELGSSDDESSQLEAAKRSKDDIAESDSSSKKRNEMHRLRKNEPKLDVQPQPSSTAIRSF